MSVAGWMATAVQEEAWPYLEPSVYQTWASTGALPSLNSEGSGLIIGVSPNVSTVNVTGPNILGPKILLAVNS